jgi:hypothetical protein
MNSTAINSFIMPQKNERSLEGARKKNLSSFFTEKNCKKAIEVFICLEMVAEWITYASHSFVLSPPSNTTKLSLLLVHEWVVKGLNCIQDCLLYDYYSSKHFSIISLLLLLQSKRKREKKNSIGLAMEWSKNPCALCFIYCYFEKATPHTSRKNCDANNECFVNTIRDETRCLFDTVKQLQSSLEGFICM